MKIVVTDACISAGQCVRAAPKIFAQHEDDGTAVVLQETPPSEMYEAVRTAASGCPARAIQLIEEQMEG